MKELFLITITKPPEAIVVSLTVSVSFFKGPCSNRQVISFHLGTIHLRHWQIFTSFDPYPPTIGIPAKCLWRGFLILMYCDLWTIGTWRHPYPPKTCCYLNDLSFHLKRRQTFVQDGQRVLGLLSDDLSNFCRWCHNPFPSNIFRSISIGNLPLALDSKCISSNRIQF